jgi:integrase
VVEALLVWHGVTPYGQETDWVFASPQARGRLPYYPGQFLKDRIKPVALQAGLGNIGWHTFRHSVSSWGKAALKLEETKALIRHASLATTSELYGGMDMETKRAAQKRLVSFVKGNVALPEGEAENRMSKGSIAIQ